MTEEINPAKPSVFKEIKNLHLGRPFSPSILNPGIASGSNGKQNGFAPLFRGAGLFGRRRLVHISEKSIYVS